MNAAGDRLAIGAAFNDGSINNAGHVRIYEWNSTAWVQMGADINGEAADDQFGISVSMNGAGDQLAIGANVNAGNGFRSGHVRVYEWNGTTWTQLGADIDGEAANDQSGWSISMDSLGHRLAIGAAFNADNGRLSGHVRVYTIIPSCIITNSIDTIVTCDSIIWIDGLIYFSTNNSATDTLTNSLGCDSIVTLNLTVVNLDTTVSQINNVSLSANDTSSSYQWIDCNNGNSPIIGDTNRSFVALINGSYAVALNKNGCSDTSACIQIVTVGLDDASSEESAIKVYPNPNNGSFTISVSQDWLAKTYQILDVKGSLVREGQFTNQISTIDLSSFGKGIYFMQIVGEGISKKIVVY